MSEDEVIDWVANHLDKKVFISASGRVSNRHKLAKQIVKMVRRLTALELVEPPPNPKPQKGEDE